MGRAEWDALPWWEQRALLDGMVEEELVEYSEAPRDRTVVDEQVHSTGTTTIIDRKHRMVASMQPGELAAFGLKERTLGGR